MQRGTLTYFIPGEVYSDPEWVTPLSWWHRARFGELQGWPEDEETIPSLLGTWSHELHQTCGCRRSKALLRTYTPYMFCPQTGPGRFPPAEAWFKKDDPTFGSWSTPTPIDPENRVWTRLQEWGDVHELVLERLIPGYVNSNIDHQHCSWDEAWGGGVDEENEAIPFTPTSQSMPWIPPMSSRVSDRWVQPPPTRGR
jgi:hypothetical protein